MTAWARLTGGLLVLAVYAWALRPAAVSVTPGGSASDSGVENWLRLSDDAFKAGRYADALEPTSRLVERFRNQHVYVQRLAQIFEKLDRPADEAAAWEQFVEVSPTPVEGCPQLGNAYTRAGETIKALDAFERCVAFDPRNGEMLFFLGLAYERAGRADEAAHQYRQSAELNPSNADSQLGLARLALRANRVAEAGRAANAVLTRFPMNADALLVAGLVSEREGRLQDARGFLERALASAETYVDVHIALARVEERLGRRAEARLHLTRALELDPSRRGEVAAALERTAAPR